MSDPEGSPVKPLAIREIPQQAHTTEQGPQIAEFSQEWDIVMEFNRGGSKRSTLPPTLADCTGEEGICSSPSHR